MSSSLTLRPVRDLFGSVALPADKSIAQRAALLAALGDGTSQLVNYPASADPQSTLSVLRQLGVEITEEDAFLTVEGRGLDGLRAAAEPLDCGNAGTLMRLFRRGKEVRIECLPRRFRGQGMLGRRGRHCEIQDRQIDHRDETLIENLFEPGTRGGVLRRNGIAGVILRMKNQQVALDEFSIRNRHLKGRHERVAL